jgi:hypothetical protein
MVKWSLDGPLSELYPTTPPIKEDGGHIGLVVSEEIIFKRFFGKFSIFSNGGYLGWRTQFSKRII